MSARSRLIVALSTSGLLLGVLAGARLGHPWWAAALAPAPLIVAMRCLPLPLGIAIAAAVGVASRLVAGLGLPDAALPVESALGALALVPALLADRSCVTRWPRSGALAFPVAVVITVAAARAAGSAITPLAVGPEGAIGTWAAQLSWAVPPFACAAVAQAVAGLASVENWHRPDPLSQEAREAGARRSAVLAMLLLAALFAGAPMLPQP